MPSAEPLNALVVSAVFLRLCGWIKLTHPQLSGKPAKVNSILLASIKAIVSLDVKPVSSKPEPTEKSIEGN